MNQKRAIIKNDRGYLVEFPVKDFNIKQVNILFSYANTIRGNHFHKETEEYFYIINGKVSVTTTDVNTKEEKIFIVESGGYFHVYPYNLHVLKFIEDTHIMSFYSKEFDPKDTDIYQI
jgi:dTDP-4-dehydrorhamnose 3,5-epimerase-like enzyme|tara:strand:- start:1047 stop:1400 length:354 start_codon:yes stop_codon:yes gene_type:complete